MSLCQYFTTSSCHYVTMSRCYHITSELQKQQEAGLLCCKAPSSTNIICANILPKAPY